jgi:hypothetical protein
MSQKISIRRKDGSKINCNGDGNIWHVLDKSGGPLLGQVCHHVCNLYVIHGLNEKTKDYFPVRRLILKYGNRLHISKLRYQHCWTEDTRYGPIVKIRYGYVPSSKFEYLLTHRKEVLTGDTTKVILLKKSDFSFERE